MELVKFLRSAWNPIGLLDRGYSDEFCPVPISAIKSTSQPSGPLVEYVANRFARGSIRGQIHPLLNSEAISSRMRPALNIKWTKS